MTVTCDVSCEHRLGLGLGESESELSLLTLIVHTFDLQNPYVNQKLYLFVNMCERGWRAEGMIEDMANTCHQASTKEITGID